MTSAKPLLNILIGLCGLAAVVLIFVVLGFMSDEPKRELNSLSESRRSLMPGSDALRSIQDLNNREIILDSGAAPELYPFDKIQGDPLPARCESVSCDPKILFEERFRQLKAKESDVLPGQLSAQSVDDLKKAIQENAENFKRGDVFLNDPSVYKNPF